MSNSTSTSSRPRQPRKPPGPFDSISMLSTPSPLRTLIGSHSFRPRPRAWTTASSPSAPRMRMSPETLARLNAPVAPMRWRISAGSRYCSLSVIGMLLGLLVGCGIWRFLWHRLTAQCGGRLFSGQLMARQALQDRAAQLGIDGGLSGGSGCVSWLGGAVAQAQGAQERLNAAANGGIGQAELALQLVQIAARPEERFEQRHLVAPQAGKPADVEFTLDRRAARVAVQPGDLEARLTDGTVGDHFAFHGAQYRNG